MKRDYRKDEFRYGATKSIGELINLSKFSDRYNGAKINVAIKHSTIFSFWPDIVGVKFSNLTRPNGIKASKLYVSAQNPVVIQELKLYKQKLIRKVNSYSGPLGIQIDDIIFNYKNYVQNPIKASNLIEDKPVELKKNDIEQVKLNEETISKTKEAIGKITFLSEEQKKKLENKIILAKKAKTLQENEKEHGLIN